MSWELVADQEITIYVQFQFAEDWPKHENDGRQSQKLAFDDKSVWIVFPSIQRPNTGDHAFHLKLNEL